MPPPTLLPILRSCSFIAFNALCFPSALSLSHALQPHNPIPSLLTHLNQLSIIHESFWSLHTPFCRCCPLWISIQRNKDHLFLKGRFWSPKCDFNSKKEVELEFCQMGFGKQHQRGHGFLSLMKIMWLLAWDCRNWFYTCWWILVSLLCFLKGALDCVFSSFSTSEPSKIPLNFSNETELSFWQCDHVLLSPLIEFIILVSFFSYVGLE